MLKIFATFCTVSLISALQDSYIKKEHFSFIFLDYRRYLEFENGED
jgi:hypothetical protein